MGARLALVARKGDELDEAAAELRAHWGADVVTMVADPRNGTAAIGLCRRAGDRRARTDRRAGEQRRNDVGRGDDRPSARGVAEGRRL